MSSLFSWLVWLPLAIIVAVAVVQANSGRHRPWLRAPDPQDGAADQDDDARVSTITAALEQANREVTERPRVQVIRRVRAGKIDSVNTWGQM